MNKNAQVCEFCTYTKHLFLNHMERTHNINTFFKRFLQTHFHGDSNFTFQEWFYAKHQSSGPIVRLRGLCRLASQ